MKHLVTGGSGFLGNLIARQLYSQGEEVRIADIWEDPSTPSGIEFYHCDVLDPEAVQRAMDGVDIVHHHAAVVPLLKNPSRFKEVNELGTRIVAETAARSGVKYFVHMSSSAVLGTPPCPIMEDAVPCPVENYGRSKLAGEMAARSALEGSGIPLLIVRPRTILGQGRLGIFQILFSWIREGKNIYTIGPGENDFQFVHALDLLNAYLLSVEKGITGILHVGTDRFGSLGEALENLVAYAGTGSRVKHLPEAPAVALLHVLDRMSLSPLAPWHYLTISKPFFFDLKKLLALGWKPKYSNDEMLKESYDWFCTHRDAGIGENPSPHRRSVIEGVLKWVKFFS